MTRTAIVGGGAAGLSLAMMLDGDVTIYEKQMTPGGLCRSTHHKGFTWDRGPHILGGIPDAVSWVLHNSQGVDWVVGNTRNAGIIGHDLVPHPFQDEATGLSYMAKMWKRDPSELSIGGLNVQAKRKPGGVSHFSYPRHGGYQAITDAWMRKLDGKTRIVHERIPPGRLPTGYDRLVWAAPTRHTEYNHLLLVTAGFKGPRPDYTAVYCPDKSSLVHRVSFPSKFSPHNAPSGYWLAQGEISMREPGWPEQNQADFLRLLARICGGAQAPEFLVSQLVYDAYPVPLADRVEEDSRIIYHGRSGAGLYLNLDGVVASSMELAERLNSD